MAEKNSKKNLNSGTASGNDASDSRGDFELQLAECRRRMSTLLQNLPGISYRCLRDEEWTMLDISDRCLELTGYSPEELIGNKGIAYSQIIHPDDRYYVWKEINRATRKHLSFTIEYRIIDKNQNQKWVWEKGVAAGKSQDGFEILEGFITDISARRKAEKALQESHERFLTVLNSIDATIHAIDAENFEILCMNENMIRLYGGDFTGETCWKIFKKKQERCSFCNMEQVLEENEKGGQVKVWQDWNHVTGRCYLCYDRIIKWTDQRPVKIQIATDITELKRLEEELSQAHKMEAIGTLAGGIAHEFNNILGIILGNTDLAIDEIPEWSPAGEFLSEVRKASFRGKEVVKQLLSFSRRSALEIKPVDMVRTIREALVFIKASLPATINLSENLSDKCPPVKADQTQINQVLLNLCNNAYQAMENGGKLEITLGRVSVKKEKTFLDQRLEPGEYVCLKVADTGPGIPVEVQERIFDPFYTTKEVNKGTGMGLAVVLGIIKDHEGFVDLESAPGQGTRMSCYFPVSDVAVSDSVPHSRQPAGGSETILFVDDEISIVKMFEHQLSSLGYQMITRSNPLEALEYYREHREDIDLVITDMTMPEMTGDRLLKEMKQINPRLKSIICTGYSSRIHEDEGDFAGADGYIQKPFDKRDLDLKIREIFDSRPANSRG